jgi:hypothetical protein
MWGVEAKLQAFLTSVLDEGELVRMFSVSIHI